MAAQIDSLSPYRNAAYKFHSDQEADWQMIFSLARRCKGRDEFIQMLKLEGEVPFLVPCLGVM